MFNDRIDAGRQLAERFADLRDRDDVIVLGLPRGGVPVAAEVARAIAAPLDILLVRKLGVPGHEELAMGAIASGNHLVRDDEIITYEKVSENELAAAVARERQVLLQREQRYRGNRPHPDLHGKIVVIIDDGLATGSTMRVAIASVTSQHPAQVLVGVPVGAPDRVSAIGALVDRIECALVPDGFLAVGQWYRHFSATTDDEVLAALVPYRCRETEGDVAMHDPQPDEAPRVIGPNDGHFVDLGALAARFLIWGEETDGRFSLVEHPIPPRTLAAPLHRHVNEDEYSYVLEGELGMILGDTVITARAGELVFKPRNQWHTFWNAGDCPCRILEIISPGGFERLFAEMGADPDTFTGDSAPDLDMKYNLDVDYDSIERLCAEHGLAFPDG